MLYSAMEKTQKMHKFKGRQKFKHKRNPSGMRKCVCETLRLPFSNLIDDFEISWASSYQFTAEKSRSVVSILCELCYC